MFQDTDTLTFFMLNNVNRLRRVLTTINFMGGDLLLSDYGAIDTGVVDVNPDFRAPILHRMSDYPALISEMKQYRAWLAKNKLRPIEREIASFISQLDSQLIGWDPNSSHYRTYSSLYSKRNVMRQLYADYSNLFKGFLDVLIELKKHYNIKIAHISESIKLLSGDLYDEIKVMYGEYDALLSSVNNENIRDLIQSSGASFEAGLTQLDQSHWVTVYSIKSTEDDMKRRIYSYYVSSLFLLVSAHEKLLYALAIHLGSKDDLAAITFKRALDFIGQHNPSLQKEIVKSGRHDKVLQIRGLRNEFTHRISTYRPDELRGDLRTLIVELHGLLNIFARLLPKQALAPRNADGSSS